MGSDRHFAWQQSSGPNVRLGSITDIEAFPRDVRFTPESGHRNWPVSASTQQLGQLGDARRDPPRDYAAFSRGYSSVMPMIRAMATETVVDPAMANWRSPIWPTKHAPNNPARDRTDRTRNHKA